MKLLLDESLSPRLASSLQDLYPGAAHVADCGLGASSMALEDSSDTVLILFCRVTRL